MKLFMLSFVLVGALVLAAQADPEPEPAKGRRSSYFNEPANPKFRSALIVDDEAEVRQAEADAADDNESDTNNAPAGQADGSSGRLFMKKFLLFKNMFGSNNQQQPVIPIIITGGGATGTGGTGTAAPTTTITSTGSIPTATGTITTSPITTRSATNHRSGYTNEEQDEEFDAEEAAAAATEEQALQAALGAGAQEYIVTNQEIQGTSDSKGSKQPSRINLKRKGGKRGQMISVRIPNKYRNMFKNGQRVMLNTGKRPVQNKRRVYKKRGNNKRRRVANKNKRTRIVAA